MEAVLNISGQFAVVPLPPKGVTVVGLSPVPEPTTLLLVGTTALGLGVARWSQWRRTRRQE